ncbi:MAG: hypothetical protein DHS20C14_10870 [Phycisphaeraceae bacterium]|nr:MAG: hypothetical protein DHS20C14_10870 [Phycisphaeraceae bacterium]
MSEAATPLDTAQGFAPPTVTQFSVFLTNKVGKMLDLVENFEDSPCQICALSVHEASDHAVVRIIANCAANAKKILQEDKLPFSEHDVLVVELDYGHSLSGLCLSLLGAELNIAFAYPLMLKPNGKPTIALAVDDPTLAGQILRRKGFRLLGEADLPQF